MSERPEDCDCEGFEPYTHYSYCSYIKKQKGPVSPMNRCSRFVVEGRCERQTCHTGPCGFGQRDGRWHYAAGPPIPVDSDTPREPVVWADEASPFTGAQVKTLLDENERLRDALEKIEGGEGCYTPSYGDCCDMGCARVAREALEKLDGRPASGGASGGADDPE